MGEKNIFDYYGALGTGTHTISGVSFFFERYLPYPYFIIEVWDKDGTDYEKDLVFRAKLEIGISGVATYDYNGLWTSASYCPACPGWMPWDNYDSPQGYHTTYPLIEYFMVIDFTEVEHHQYTV